MKRILILCTTGLLFVSCGNNNVLTPGIWRAALLTEHSVEIPFNFELELSPADTLMYIITGTDRYKVKDISMVGDSMFINLPLFSAKFALLLENGALNGNFIRSSYTMPVRMVPGDANRFKVTKGDASQAAGRWLISLNTRNGVREIIGEFEEHEEKVTGSFLTPTGDYRFFEGTVNHQNQLMLSSFDGSFVRLFLADINGDRLENLKMYSGSSGLEEGSGIKNPDAALPDAYAVTGLKKGYTSLGFSFPNVDGVPVSLKDERFTNKVVVVQISGSWCPNCLDESRFLMEMYRKYAPKVDMLCLAFERVTDFEEAKKEAMKLATTAGIEYDVLITGHSSSAVQTALPELDNFRSFPTTIIIDKKGEVRQIHSGFSGPGTGIHYRNYVQKFEEFINKLLAEPDVKPNS
ncbi:MAG: TlpA family protein disulfide reductase [Bacteroidales bacterium]|nr:TlpA family protein disulfide reductase [Bacteroidales bacterium]MCL2737859.1 TlpA family protein disulfide reductase [Bacteroidales bacterium]